MKKKTTAPPVTSTDRVLHWVQEFIETHKLKPGDSLPKELEIAEQVGVARSSVREALTALKALGIITSRKKGGIRIVREPALLGMREYLTAKYTTRSCFADAMEFRSILEHGLAELIFSQITRKEIVALRKLIKEVRGAPAGSIDTYDAEKKFHTLLTTASRNRLAQLLSALYTPVFETAREMLEEENYGHMDWVNEHESPVAALEQQNKDVFVRWVYEHTRKFLRFNGKGR